MDRHLLGLKLTADENDLETPDLFTDVAYTRSLHFCISTSQVGQGGGGGGGGGGGTGGRMKQRRREEEEEDVAATLFHSDCIGHSLH